MAVFRFAICISVLAGVLSGHPDTLLAQSLKTPDFQERATKGFDHVLNRTFPKVMINPEYVRFGESAQYDFVKVESRFKVVAKWLFDNDACANGTTRILKMLDDCSEQHRWNGQIMGRMLRWT